MGGTPAPFRAVRTVPGKAPLTLTQAPRVKPASSHDRSPRPPPKPPPCPSPARVLRWLARPAILLEELIGQRIPCKEIRERDAAWDQLVKLRGDALAVACHRVQIPKAQAQPKKLKSGEGGEQKQQRFPETGHDVERFGIFLGCKYPNAVSNVETLRTEPNPTCPTNLLNEP